MAAATILNFSKSVILGSSRMSMVWYLQTKFGVNQSRSG